MLEFLTVFKASQNKKRYGSNKDGGYVIVDGLTYDLLLSCGIEKNIDFENHFLNVHDVPCHAFDGTIERLPQTDKNIKFHKLNVGPKNSTNTSNLHQLLNQFKNIFLKMDIETFEYRWFNTLSPEQIKSLKQIVIEFHFPFTLYPFSHLDIQLSIDEKMKVFENLSKTHKLVHFHANNCCGTTLFENTVVPNVFECTYIRNDCFVDNGKNTDPIPSLLDRTNVKGNDLILDWPPFVTK